MDADAWAGSPLFDAIDGFGGNGMWLFCYGGGVLLWRWGYADRTDPGPYVSCEDQPFESFCVPNGTGGGCVLDGPFRNLTLHLGPGENVHRNDHCLRRNFHLQSIQNWFSTDEVEGTLGEGSYFEFWRRLEGLFEVHRIGLHGAGHLGVGGEYVSLFMEGCTNLVKARYQMCIHRLVVTSPNSPGSGWYS